MRKRSFGQLQTHLLEAGIAPEQAQRIAAELRDHLEDLLLEAEASGLSQDDARTEAERRLGEPHEIASRVLERTEFKTWPYRYPCIARVYLPLAYVLLLPASPIFAGIANPSMLARWTAALMLSTAVTATMLLCMQLAIVLT